MRQDHSNFGFGIGGRNETTWFSHGHWNILLAILQPLAIIHSPYFFEPWAMDHNASYSAPGIAPKIPPGC